MNPRILGASGGLAALLAATASAQIGFQPATLVPVGPTPDATAVGDLDGDGDLDLAVANDAPDKVSLLLNAGNGTFGAPNHVFLAGGSSPHTPAAGDLDGDGDLDLAVSLKNSNAVQLLVNNGGAFTPGASFGVGAGPRDLLAADLDGDGDLDLAVSNRDGDSVSVLRNQGGLSFSVASYATGADPRELAAGDFTGDGLLDLAVAAHDDRAVSVLANQGGGAFAALATLSTAPLRPQGLDAGDVDGSGTIDLVAAASNNGVEFATVLRNNGGGSFAAPASFPLLGLDASSLVLADLDLNGSLDVATANVDSANVSALANNGSGGYGAAQLFGVGTNPGHVARGDLDGNGSPDLVTTNEGSNGVSVLLNSKAASGCTVVTYCTSKVNSLGQAAQIGSFGVPSQSGGGFSITMAAAVPGSVTIAFWSQSGPAGTPFMGGFLCVQPPTIRFPPQAISGAGTAAYAVAVTAAMSGTTRWYQFWHRDPAHPDGTNVALSDGLAVTFCD